jgi:glutamate dehydrogenase
VETLDNEVAAGVQIEMLGEGRRLVERSTRRLVEGEDGSLPIAATARRFESGAELLAESLPEILDDAGRELFDSELARLLDAGVPEQLAARVIGMRWLPAAFDIVAVAGDTGVDQRLVMETHFGLNARLELGWLRDRITELPRANRWEALTRSALRDDLQALHRRLTAQVLESGAEHSSAQAAIDAWWSHNQGAIERWLATLADVRASRSYDTTTLPVALRELRALVS